MVSGGCSFPPYVRDEPCQGLGWERGGFNAASWPLAGAFGLCPCRKSLPSSGHCCCNSIWHPPARSPGSEQPGWDCSVLESRGKIAFPHYQERCHRLTPPRCPAPSIPTEKRARAVSFLVSLPLPPLSNCAAAASFKASRSRAAFLCLIGTMCAPCMAAAGAGLPAWSSGTAPAVLTWATEPKG